VQLRWEDKEAEERAKDPYDVGSHDQKVQDIDNVVEQSPACEYLLRSNKIKIVSHVVESIRYNAGKHGIVFVEVFSQDFDCNEVQLPIIQGRRQCNFVDLSGGPDLSVEDRMDISKRSYEFRLILKVDEANWRPKRLYCVLLRVRRLATKRIPCSFPAPPTVSPHQRP